ncbi:SDR family NAD(P)-dependent oxidoreductase [Novosphingobium cyanobacteriorum]|uniref:SDR family NAD(P)-dependent oxidoreductase n=1 Tax=Novosphingobium cyanobacteriorum TaxID=3024215 RepID=A0ABT6CLE0_9SPHN|nr:SDR family NAD(P)-dependent oxidoreductase [Novosphingobium cyanobacteriorum]MDF8334606.1 SDR family NAD(P)-dependent oxidoreductase [Novosphingobium cyanobacteriorum]
MSIDFTGRTVIVTGAGGGLGRAYALDIARRGGNVVVNDLGGNVAGDGGTSEMADKVVDEIRAAGGNAVANYASVATAEGGQAIARTALDSFGRIDALINNAGNLRNFWFDEFSDADRDSVMATHLLGTWNVTKAVWPHMKQAGYGRIVFTASAVAAFGNQTQSAYGAAKGGIIGLMNVLAQEGLPHNILCNGLLPNADSRMGSEMKPEEMAPVFPHIMKIGPDTIVPAYVVAPVVYMASEACTTTHDLYSVMGRRVARAFVGVTEGWINPAPAPATAEDIAANIETIRDQTRGVHIPASLIDEFRIVGEQFEALRET